MREARIAPLDFDGVHDSIYHPFDLDGRWYVEHLHEHGTYADVPYDDMIAMFRQVYPRTGSQTAGKSALDGDFKAEAARKSNR